MAQIRLKYGDHSHELSDAAVSISRVGEFNDAGVAYANRVVWRIQGRLEGDTQAAITTNINALEDAYNKQNQDISLQFDDGTNTAHAITIKDTLDGIRVSAAPSYPIGEGAEYATFRNYTIVVEALVKTSQLNSALVTWTETVSTSGGNPRDVVIETLNTLPIIQRTANATAFIVTQQGRAVGLDGWPEFPTFVLANAAILRNGRSRRSPRDVLVGSRRYRSFWEVTWNYVFADVRIQAALPHRRPTTGKRIADITLGS